MSNEINDPLKNAAPSDDAIDSSAVDRQQSMDGRSPRGDEDLVSSQRNPIAPAGTEGFQGTSDAELAEIDDDLSAEPVDR